MWYPAFVRLLRVVGLEDGLADAVVDWIDADQVVQGAGETRIAAAAGVPPVIVGLSEGLAASTYSNYAQARRRLADGTLRPLWRNFAGSMEHLLTVPPGAELWYDDRDISFLKEDVKDAADIVFIQSQGVRHLVDAGFEPDTVIAAIDTGDLTRLKHTGLFSVQLQTPGSLKLPELPPTVPGEPKPGGPPAPTNKPGGTGDPVVAPIEAPAVAPAKPAASLEGRELEAALRIARGQTNKEIAGALSLSERTVERTVSSAMANAGVSSRTELATWVSTAGATAALEDPGIRQAIEDLAATVSDRGATDRAFASALVAIAERPPIQVILPGPGATEREYVRNDKHLVVKTIDRPVKE